MAQPVQNQVNDVGQREIIGESMFLRGCDSGIPSYAIQSGGYIWGENIVNRGGVLQTRPGYKFTLNLPDGNLQGLTAFKPSDTEKTYLIFAVDGLIYQSGPPYTGYTQIAGLHFSNRAKFVYWQETIQVALRQLVLQPDGITYEYEYTVIPPKRILFMQDGMGTRCGFWDGSTARHCNPGAPDYECPPGGPMAWVGDRLWSAQDNNLYVSDYADPLHFTENTYLFEGLPWQLPDDCTALKVTADSRGLLAFTRNTTTAFQTNIRDRNIWKTTTDFQRIILPGIGCIAHRSCINQYGMMWFMSPGGLTNVNDALQTYRDSRVIYSDREMARSKGNISQVFDNCAGTAVENYLLMSVPSGDIYNAHTWVLDQATFSDVNSNGAQTSWNGVWTGVRPVEWANPYVYGMARHFFVSRDYTEYGDTKNRLWEAFVGRKDSGSDIQCLVETRLHALTPDLSSLRYAELAFGEVTGEVFVEVFWRGLRGGYKKCMEKTIVATNGPFGSEFMRLITDGIPIESFRKQYRYLKTEQISDGKYDVPVEGDENGNIDRGFSLLIKWTGQAALLGYRIFLDPYPQVGRGGVEFNEIPERIETETGTGYLFII